MRDADRPLRRRQVLAGLGGTAAVGLAGCLGSGGDGPETDDTSNGGGSGGSDTPGTGPGAGEQIDDISCTEFGSAELQPYSTADSPLVFNFAYPDSWIESGSSPDQRRSRYAAILHSEIIDSSNQTFLTAGQWFEPIAPADLEEKISTEVEARSGNEQFEIVRTLDYAGETLDVYSTPEYPEGLTSVFWLPYETADGLRYFQAILIFGYSNSFIAGVDGSDVELYCESLFADLADLVFSTIEPNAETAIEAEL